MSVFSSVSKYGYRQDMSAFSLWFKNSSKEVHVCFLFPQADMIEIEDNAERCGLLSFSLLSQNHQKLLRHGDVSPSLSLVQDHRNAPVQHQTLCAQYDVFSGSFSSLSKITKSVDGYARWVSVSVCLKVLKIGPFTEYVRFWLFCGGRDQKAKRMCSCLFCLSLSLLSQKHQD